MSDKRTKWTIVHDKEKTVVQRAMGIAWTYDRAEADEWANILGGRVVDAEDFAKNPRFRDELHDTE